MAANGARVATEMKERIDAMIHGLESERFHHEHAPGAGDWNSIYWNQLGEHLKQARESLVYSSNTLENTLAEMRTRGITVDSGSIESRLDQAKAETTG